MLSEQQKEKNVKDLEYNHLLNKQNVGLAFFGSGILAVLLAKDLPAYIGLARLDILVFLISGAITVFLYFGHELQKKAQEIRNIGG